MAQAQRDNSGVPTLIGTSNVDGESVVLVSADATTHALSTSDAATGSDLSDDIASRDQNRVPVMMAVSEVDGITPVAIYADPATGLLLTDSS